MQQGEMNLGAASYVGMARELLKHWWVILLFGVSVFLAVTGFGRLTYVPEYTVSATLAVTAKGSGNTYASLSMASQMATVMGEVFQSDVMRQLVQKETGESLEGRITCSQISETNLLVLNIMSEDPENAYQFMNSALNHYDEVSDYVFSNASLQVLQEPSIPTAPSNQPRLFRFRLLLPLLGALGMMGVIILLYFLRYTVKSSRGAYRQLDGTILGILPYERKGRGRALKKSKEALLISSPTVSMNYAESCRRLSNRVEQHLRKEGRKALLVTSVSENEGKSTVAANLALSLAEKQLKVLLVDGDLRKPAQHKVFERQAGVEHSFDRVLEGSLALQNAVVYNENTNIYELFLYEVAKEPGTLLAQADLKGVLRVLKSTYDYVIIDCSPTSISADAEVWMAVADSTLLVARQDWSDVRVINDTVDLVWQTEGDLTGFALNMFLEEGLGRYNSYSYENYRGGTFAGEEGR